MFWRLFGYYAALVLSAIGLLGAIIVDRVERQYVRLDLPPEEIQVQMAQLQRLVWTTAGLTGLAAMGLALWLARRLAQPLQVVTAGAEKIAAGAYGHAVYVDGRDEAATLARAFNRMSERLATQFAQLEEDRQQLRAILGGLVEGVIALDADLRILFANHRAAQLLEFHPQAVVGRKLWEVLRQRTLQDLVRKALAGPEPCQAELKWNGTTPRNLTVHAARLAGVPAPRGAVLVVHDTSELRRLEQLRQDFVANVSHELKTPLSVIKACIETLQDGAIDDAQHRDMFLEQVNEQTDRLHALILDLLSLARIESGEECFKLEAVPLEPLVSACLERHCARAESNHQVLLAIPPEGPADEAVAVDALADEEALGQILDNLVDNALKYTPQGGSIRVRWCIEGEEVRLEVEDTGIGIPERDLSRIFERFYRVDRARSRELGGTGLGLAIVKHLVQAMHGSVRAASKPGQGSTFTVRLPRAPTK
jgi:two-component system phosphate regulon sensor histidine kinase PhoR